MGPELSVEDSIKYQVLSEGTAFIGVVEQDNLGEELEEIEPIRFGQGVIRLPEPEFPFFEEEAFFGGGAAFGPVPFVVPSISIAQPAIIGRAAIAQPSISI